MSGIMKKIILILAVIMACIMGFATASYAESNWDIHQPAAGYYKIEAVNGHGKGQQLYYDENASKKVLKWKKTGTTWYIHIAPGWGNYASAPCVISPIEDSSKAIGKLSNAVNSDYDLIVDKISNLGAYCIRFNDYNHNGDFQKVTIILQNDDPAYATHETYSFNRHSAFAADDYVNIAEEKDTNNKLWRLVPVKPKLVVKATQPTLTSVKANTNGRISLIWEKIKNKDLWKRIKSIEIQCSTDKAFEKNVISRTIDKDSSRLTGKNLKKNTTYYVRIRFTTVQNVTSRWSKTKQFRTNTSST